MRLTLDIEKGKTYKWKLTLSKGRETTEWESDGNIHDLLAEIAVVFGENINPDKLTERILSLMGAEDLDTL